MHASRINRIFTIDSAGQAVDDDVNAAEEYERAVLKAIAQTNADIHVNHSYNKKNTQ